MKIILSLLVATAILLPTTSQAAFRWPWQMPASVAPKSASVVPAIDPNALKQGTDKVKKWELVVGAKKPKVGEKIALEFTEAELVALTREAVGKLKDAQVEASSLQVRVTDGKLTVAATILKPVKFNVQVIVSATVKDGKLVPKIEQAKAGYFPVSGQVVEKLVGQIFGAKWRESLNRPQFSWDQIKLTNGKMLVAGRMVKVKK